MSGSPSPSFIVGAGLAGLLAAHAWPRAQVLERATERSPTHRALLRFRSDAVSRLVGIPFRPVRVRKGIWWNGGFHPPDIRLANWYSRKVTGSVAAERSIWNLDAAERFIAPLDFYDQLVDAVGTRIVWAHAFDKATGEPVVSTAPLSETAATFLESRTIPPSLRFERAPITVQRFLLPEDFDVHQTVYFPDPECAMYRASITGRLVILEYAGAEVPVGQLREGALGAARAFGLEGGLAELTPEDAGSTHRQTFGKITPLRDDDARRTLLFRLTHEHNIYSLGRFAIWKNILLDDVVHDIDVINRLLRSGSVSYDFRKDN